MNILVVEDDTISRKVMLAMLGGFAECESAVNGEEAVEKFVESLNKNTPFDIVFLDIMLPKLSGLEVLKQIREIEEKRDVALFSRTKILMTTALSDVENIKTAFNYQCEGYLIKPISKERLFEEIRNIGFEVG